MKPWMLLWAMLPTIAFFGLPAIASAKTKIHVYSATDLSAVSAVIEEFEKKNPGIKVVYREFITNDLQKIVLDRHDDPGFEADVVISSAMDLQVALVNMGLAAPFPSASRAAIPGWAQWRNELYGFTYEPAAIIYNKAAFKGRALPRTHSELAGMIRDDPALFDGRVGTYDIRRSGIGYLFATQDAIQGYQTFRLTESLGRAHARTYCCTSDMLEAVAKGEVVLSYNVIASYALAEARRDARIGVHFLDDFTLVMARTAFVLKSSRRKDAAIKYVEFLLSREGQELIARNSALLPIRVPSASDLESPRAVAMGRRSFIPIKLGTGLLAFLDRLKKETFLRNWEASIRPPP